jgi:hypothetical protein
MENQNRLEFYQAFELGQSHPLDALARATERRMIMAICETCDYANRPPYKSPCSECDKTMGSPFCCYEHEEKPTNADRIRAMTDEELAKFLECFGLCHHCTEHHRLGDVRFYQDEKCDEQCEQHCLEWLKQPAEGDA